MISSTSFAKSSSKVVSSPWLRITTSTFFAAQLPGWLAGLLGGGDVKLLVGGVMPLSLSLLLLVLQRLLLLLLLLALLLLLWQLYLQWRATGRWQFATALMMSRRQRLPFAPLLVLALFSGVGIA